MFLTSYIFKSKAVRALKGNWQTALIVSFIAGLPATISSLLRSIRLPAVSVAMSPDELLNALRQVEPGTYWVLGIAGLLSFLLTPVLSVSCYQYFIKRIQGVELGVMGAVSRRKIFLRSLLLYAYMYARILLWSLLLVVPGVIAALRYAMAPYFLAENPELTPAQAIDKSKEAMADKKLSLLMLLLSFIGWALMAVAAQIFLLSFSVIIAMVAYQFIELFRVTYRNASVSAFYLAVSRAEGIADAKREADAFMRQIGARIPRGGSDEEKDDEAGGGEDKE